MKMRFAPVASAVTVILLLSACGDDDDSSTTTSESSTTTTEAPADGATTLAKGDVELLPPGTTGGTRGQRLNVSAEEGDGEVTGEIRLSDPDGEVVVAVECADTDTDGVVILGGTVTEADDDDISGLVALFIREGDRDSVAVWYDEGENPSCGDLLKNRHDVLDDDRAFVWVGFDSGIETG
jgi:hypothetical protein